MAFQLDRRWEEMFQLDRLEEMKHYNEKLMTYIEKRDWQSIRRLLNERTIRGIYLECNLEKAILAHAPVDIVEMLLKEKGLTPKHNYKNSPQVLDLALREGLTEITEVLLQHPECPQKLDSKFWFEYSDESFYKGIRLLLNYWLTIEKAQKEITSCGFSRPNPQEDQNLIKRWLYVSCLKYRTLLLQAYVPRLGYNSKLRMLPKELIRLVIKCLTNN